MDEIKYEDLLARVENTDQHVTCCEPCHFSWEENYAIPYLPREVAKWLVEDHKRVMRGGMKPKDILKHAKEEMVYFRKYLPKDVLERIEADHLKFCMNNGFDFELNGKVYHP